MNACFVQCPLFVWMYVASQKSQSSLECIQISVTVHRFYTLKRVYYSYTAKMKPMNKEYVGRRRVLAGSAHALTCFILVSALDAYSLFTDRLKHIAHKNARASEIICFSLPGNEAVFTR